MELLDRIGSIVEQLEAFMEDLNVITIGDESTGEEFDMETSDSDEEEEDKKASEGATEEDEVDETGEAIDEDIHILEQDTEVQSSGDKKENISEIIDLV